MAVHQVIYLRYNDLRALDDELRRLFPDGDYTVEVRA